ncbi:Hypothetical predicted protein [Paramuricea clavata]|uniref:Uncharacterized protein n=1 Tax=Paramuricea clavata TaxID=317549 RepID=A0A7D9DCH2_PARCT|nr:Hypothetical predicted protein [Paramuricea clavata]
MYLCVINDTCKCKFKKKIVLLIFNICPRAKERLSRYVNSWGKAVLDVPGDGHCIIYSLFVVLTEQHIDVQIDSKSQLLNIIEVEIMNNLDFYGPFLGNIDMVKQWRLYKEKGLYDQDIVDLCLHAVANCTGITVDVIQATDHGIRNVVVEPNKPGISSHRTIHLTNSHDHYNPVVSAQTKNYECNPTLRQQLVIKHPKNEKKHDEKEDRYDYINPNLYIDSSSPLSLNNRYAALGDSSDDCFIVEPHNKKCPHLSGNFAAKSSTFDEQFDLKDEQINAIDQKRMQLIKRVMQVINRVMRVINGVLQVMTRVIQVMKRVIQVMKRVIQVMNSAIESFK